MTGRDPELFEGNIYDGMEHDIWQAVGLYRAGRNPWTNSTHGYQWQDSKLRQRFLCDQRRPIAASRSPFSKSVLRPVTVLLIKFYLFLIQCAGVQICIMAESKRSDKAITESWLSVLRLTLPDQKNLRSEGLDIIAIFRHQETSDIRDFARLCL